MATYLELGKIAWFSWPMTNRALTMQMEPRQKCPSGAYIYDCWSYWSSGRAWVPKRCRVLGEDGAIEFKIAPAITRYGR